LWALEKEWHLAEAIMGFIVTSRIYMKHLSYLVLNFNWRHLAVKSLIAQNFLLNGPILDRLNIYNILNNVITLFFRV